MHPISPIVPTGLVYGTANLINQHFNRIEAEKARKEQHALTRELEGSRREMQLTQMKVSILHQHSNQEHQRALAMENQKFQAILQKQNHEFQREIEEFRQRVNIAINERNIEFQKWRLAQEKQLQLHIVELNQQFQRELVATQHQNAKELIYENYRVNKESPIINLAKDLIDDDPLPDGTYPLKILFAPPELDHEPNRPPSSGKESGKNNFESYLAVAIRKFINYGYDIHRKERPTEFFDKAWKSKEFGGGSAFKTLHKLLKPVSTLILESGFAQGKLNLHYWYWDGSQDKPRDEFLLDDVSFFDYVKTLARERARECRAVIINQAQAGISSEGSVDEPTKKNILNLDKEEKAIAEIRASTLSAEEKEKSIQQKQKFFFSQYVYTNEDETAFYDYLAVQHCLIIGIVADLQALQRSCTNYPLLPKLLPSLFEKLKLSSQENQQAIAEIVKLYHQFCEGLSKQPEYNSLVPDLALDLALALCDLKDKSLAVKETKYSVAQWLDLHGLEPGKVFDQENEADRELLRGIIFQEDNAYLEKLQQVVENFGTVTDEDFAQVRSLLEGWQNLKRWSTIPSMADVPQSEAEEKTAEKQTDQEKQESTSSTDGLSTFSFEVVTVDKQGEIIKRETKSAQYYTEILPGGVELEMVLIPGGKLKRGLESDPQTVWISPFYVSKYPITQAQWKAVTKLPEVKHSLGEDISGFKDDNFPVEKVLWWKAEEFCSRLSKATNSYYRLPSESQWEYACRAGTDTAFHFGQTITDQLANYNSKEIDLNCNPKDIPLVAQQNGLSTSIVGSFPPNAFGLYDMHGNVWEWCADPINTYGEGFFEGAPQDGSVWIGKDSDIHAHMMRGGSWISCKDECTSSTRECYPPDELKERDIRVLLEKEQFSVIIGFRVMCFAPRFSEILSVINN